MGTSEGAHTTARWCTLEIFDTCARVLTVILADIGTFHAGAVESWLTFAIEVEFFVNKETISIGMAVGFALGNVFARIDTFGFTCCSGLGCAVVGWTLDAGSLLRFGLVETLATFDAHVHCAV